MSSKRVFDHDDSDSNGYLNDGIPRKKLFSTTAAAAAAASSSALLSLPATNTATTTHSFRTTFLRNSGCNTNDEVHSTIPICPVMRVLIDTAAFQRLRDIKQLARADFVYMNCNHSRFEHSLGVAHLAAQLVQKIKSRQPTLKITSKDELCVKLSGLLHDIGHGPFSHQYELFVKHRLPAYRQKHPQLEQYYKNTPELPDGWRHESVSLMMIDNALESLGLKIDLQRLDEPLQQIGDGVDARSMRDFTSVPPQDGILTSRDWVFIKECIWGGPIPQVKEELGIDDLIGRLELEKEWMYDIVTNRYSGLDVDKIDYFARDERRAKRASGEIDTKMLDNVWVTRVECLKGSCRRCRQNNGHHMMLCYPEKMEPTCLDFFKKRHHLHSYIYQHKAVVSAGYLVLDILCEADPYYRVSATKYRPKTAKPPEYDTLPISRAMLDPYAFLDLTDTIIDLILASTDPRLARAHEIIIHRYKPRDKLYKHAASQGINMEDDTQRDIWNESRDTQNFEKQILHINGIHGRDDGDGHLMLKDGDFFLDRCSIHHGAKEFNPLDKMRFIPKELVDELREGKFPIAKEPKDQFLDLPRHFQKNILRVFSRDDTKVRLVQHVFESWFSAATDQFQQTICCNIGCYDDDNNNGNPYPPAATAVLLSQESVYPPDDDDDNEQQQGETSPYEMIDLQASTPGNAKDDRDYD